MFQEPMMLRPTWPAKGHQAQVTTQISHAQFWLAQLRTSLPIFPAHKLWRNQQALFIVALFLILWLTQSRFSSKSLYLTHRSKKYTTDDE